MESDEDNSQQMIYYHIDLISLRFLSIRFRLSAVPPMIWVPNQLIAASTASQVQLICNTEASPRSINYWTKDDQGTVAEKDRFSMKLFERGYKFEMILTISDVQEQDFGTYRCISRNSLGSTEGTVKLYSK